MCFSLLLQKNLPNGTISSCLTFKEKGDWLLFVFSRERGGLCWPKIEERFSNPKEHRHKSGGGSRISRFEEGKKGKKGKKEIKNKVTPYCKERKNIIQNIADQSSLDLQPQFKVRNIPFHAYRRRQKRGGKASSLFMAK